MKYQILFDYGAYEGMKLQEEEYDDVDAAVKAALAMNRSVPFLIITVIAWNATYKAG